MALLLRLALVDLRLKSGQRMPLQTLLAKSRLMDLTRCDNHLAVDQGHTAAA
ncbi:MAG: hypothetical protein AABY96_05845 [Nitrospirota bacterium]